MPTSLSDGSQMEFLRITGQATAGAKTADSGGAMQGAVSVDNDIWMYQLTEKGLNVSVTVTGAKYYKDDSLN